MFLKKLLAASCILWGSMALFAQSEPLWMRYASISPDGNTIVFAYKGDLFSVETGGGRAYPLTLHEAYDFMPVWSHDGKTLAFASNRYGNFDIFTMPAEGGSPTRLTFHSSGDYPWEFNLDNKSVVFSSTRLDDANHAQFPRGSFSELYEVSVEGGRPWQKLTTTALHTHFSQDGKMMIYEDHKGTEDSWRKHHTSSVTRDIWSYNREDGSYAMLTNFEGEDREPVFAPGDKAMFYLSEESGSINVHKMDLANPGQNQQISQFEKHPVRFLSISDNGLLCYTYDGEIYTQKEGGEPQKVAIKLATDSRIQTEEIVPVKDGATEMALAPSGKEVAFIVRGEVFVTSVEGGTTKRVTNTPEQERSVSFSPDGRSLVYASERSGSWNLYQSKISREEEKYFYLSTVLNEEVVLETDQETFQPSWSPDGKEVAFLEERTELKVVNLESKEVRTIMPGDNNYSYSDGDQYYQWSPDGKWFLVEFIQPNQWIGEVGIVSSEGGKEVYNLSLSGYSDGRPKWSQGGEVMLWYSDRDGMKNHASWGSQDDVYAMYFTQDAWDKFKLNEEEYKMLKEEEKESKGKNNKKENKKGSDGDGDDEEEEKEEEVKPLEIDWDGLRDRKARLTIHSSNMSDMILDKEGEKLYYLARFEKGYDLWETDLRTRETKILLKLNSSRGGEMHLDKKGKSLFLLAGGKIMKIKLESGKKENIGINGEMRLNTTAEREYMFEHMWRQVDKKLYVVDLQGVDWAFYKKAYARFLPHINNNFDFSQMASELLGELNVSHTGCFYRASQSNAEATACLGLYYDQEYEGDGLKVVEVMKGSPVKTKDSKIKAGTIIEMIDGQPILAGENYYPLLSRKAGKYTLLSLKDPESGDKWEETVKPISYGKEYQLRYKRWVENTREKTEQLSNGRIGYVHVRGMDDGSFRTVYEEVLGRNHDKEALIVDTRFNGGGWLHDDLATFLAGKAYLTFMPRGQNLGTEPQFKWTKPSAVLMGEANYSDAHMFPFAYRELGIGKLIGMPVPGTGTAVWWENLQDPSLVFGIPQVGMMIAPGKFLENTQLEPDVKVRNWPSEIANNRDQQIEKAVEVLLKDLGTR